MFVDHNTYGIPAQVGGITIKPLSWDDFKGTPPPQSPYVAHIYWNINYQFGNYSEGCLPSLNVSVNVRPKSWRVKEQIKLLQHQYGHYLIGCLCALSFVKKMNYDLVKDVKGNYGDWCKQVLARCLKQYCAFERVYDNETHHNLDKQKQKQWQAKIRDQFWEFHNFFQKEAQINLVVDSSLEKQVEMLLPKSMTQKKSFGTTTKILAQKDRQRIINPPDRPVMLMGQTQSTEKFLQVVKSGYTSDWKVTTVLDQIYPSRKKQFVSSTGS